MDHVSHAFALKLAGAGVTVAESVVLRELYDSESAPSTLANRLGMNSGAISKFADRLIAKEMIVGRPRIGPPVPVLALTRRGQAITPEPQLTMRTMRNFLPSLDIETRERIATALKDIVGAED